MGGGGALHPFCGCVCIAASSGKEPARGKAWLLSGRVTNTYNLMRVTSPLAAPAL